MTGDAAAMADMTCPIPVEKSPEWWTIPAPLTRLAGAARRRAGARGLRMPTVRPKRETSESRRRGLQARCRHIANCRIGTQDMPIRLKKLIGTVLLVALVIVYALIASAIAA